MHDPELSKIVDRLKQLPQFYEALLADLCFQVMQVLRETTPGTTLPEEWTTQMRRTGDRVTALIWNQREVTDPAFQEIMVYLDEGTSPHFVAPVAKLALSWVENGRRYFSKGHMVSGIPASHFHSQALRAIDAYERRIPWLFDNFMRDGSLP